MHPASGARHQRAADAPFSTAPWAWSGRALVVWVLLLIVISVARLL